MQHTQHIDNWNESNQRLLMAALRELQAELEAAYPERTDHTEQAHTEQPHPDQAHAEETTSAQNGVSAESRADQSALESLVNILGLSTFERKILLLCAGVELDGSFARLVGRLNGSTSRQLPSFSLALAVLGDAHWSALSPDGPLRYWRLIEFADTNNAQILTQCPIKIDEHILFYLTGVRQLDERLRRLVEPLPASTDLVPSQFATARTIIDACSANETLTRLPVMQLSGNTGADKSAIAAYAASALGLDLYAMSAHSIPQHITDMMEWTRLWNRQAALTASALYLDLTSLDPHDRERALSTAAFIEHIGGLLFVSTGQWLPRLSRLVLQSETGKPTSIEQLHLWKQSLGRSYQEYDESLQRLVSQFHLSAHTIRAVCRDVNRQTPAHDDADALIWHSCCIHTRPQVDELAQRIETLAGWNDIVLPEEQKAILHEVAAQVHQRNKVYGEWGFSTTGARGLGISVLFSGESGTGKTMASEVLAKELGLDLYRIDLSQVVNKYIGETEKNLKRVFDAAEEGGAVLLFDEADALFGKRSEVKDSHDRYGNIEVSYLLQRMEAYRGLAILTTNMRSSLDKAFYRRIRFVVQFPFPDAQQRAEIWRRVFPPSTPTHGLDHSKLARLNIPGGNIRNIALNAAFIAANEGRPILMSHLSQAARSEYAKLDKPLNNLEIGMIV
jgi:hypothetical protein